MSRTEPALSSNLDDGFPEPAAHERVSPFPLVHFLRGNYFLRVLLLALLFTSELIILTIWLDGDSLVQRAGLIRIMHDWGAWILRGMIGFAAIFVTFAFLKNRIALKEILGAPAETRFHWGLFAAHCSAMIAFGLLSSALYSGAAFIWAQLLAASWFATGISAIAFGGFAFVPWAVWAKLIRSTGRLWAYALTASVSACVVGDLSRLLWQPASHATFGLTKFFLSFFVSSIVSNPATLVVGTQRFRVQIAPGCSGLEGVGLVLAFTILWLVVFGHDCRFPRALVLIPFGVASIFLLNAVRITALVLIGNAGYREIAVSGFHSQAGWIAFSLVCVAFCVAIQYVPWFTKRRRSRESLGTSAENPAAALLLPFLVILAAGMIASAATAAGGFEWLYPLRFFAAAGMLWAFRSSYSNLSWRFDWLAFVIGAVVFVIWIAPDRISSMTAENGVYANLMNSSMSMKFGWITIRVLAAVVTVPLAEELAFRGFLMRRLITSDVGSISLRRFSWFALLASSIVFGILHGGYWIAGSIAGVLFGLAMLRRGRIGDAVVAHATANALLAAYVLTYHKWHFW